ncbi:MAG: leucine-rich repeat protein, partial [Paramuribaculum sp.]|nr:leucine-rich repeat protein [Paramuribaculum sp.]
MKIDFTTAIRSLLLLLIGFVAASASAQTLEIDGMTFEMRDDGTCSLVKLNYDNITKFDVPENVEYEGQKYTVTALGNDVCHFAWEIEKLSLPYTIERIGNDCFSECHIGELVLHGAFPPRATSWSFGDVLPDIQMTPPSYVYIGKIVVPKGTSEFYKWAPGWRHHYKYYGNIAVEESDESAKISNHEKRFVSHGWVAERIVRSGDKTESVRLLYPMTAGEARPLTLPSTLENNGKNWEVSELGDESLVYSLYTELILPPTMRRIGDCPIIYSSISRIRGIQTIEELGRSAAVGKALRRFEMPKAINQVSNGLFHFGGSPRGNFDRIELHENVNYVANYSFFNVDVRNLVCYNPEPPVTEVQSFASDYELSAVLGTLHVPEGSVEAYKEAPGWREFK